MIFNKNFSFFTNKFYPQPPLHNKNSLEVRKLTNFTKSTYLKNLKNQNSNPNTTLLNFKFTRLGLAYSALVNLGGPDVILLLLAKLVDNENYSVEDSESYSYDISLVLRSLLSSYRMFGIEMKEGLVKAFWGGTFFESLQNQNPNSFNHKYPAFPQRRKRLQYR